MSDLLEIVSFFSNIWGLYGFVFLIIGIVLLQIQRKKEKSCTTAILGVVVDKVRKNHASSSLGLRCILVIEYYVNNKQIRVTYNTIRNLKNYAVGQQITIHYDPEHPTTFVTEGETLQRTLAYFLISIGFISIFITTLLVVITFICS